MKHWPERVVPQLCVPYTRTYMGKYEGKAGLIVAMVWYLGVNHMTINIH